MSASSLAMPSGLQVGDRLSVGRVAHGTLFGSMPRIRSVKKRPSRTASIASLTSVVMSASFTMTRSACGSPVERRKRALARGADARAGTSRRYNEKRPFRHGGKRA